MPELPYMKLWTNRFFGSARVRSLPGLSRCVYLAMLATEWGFGSEGLPNDLDEIAATLGLDPATIKPMWGDGEKGLSQFFELRNGRLFNNTLEEVLAEEIAFRKERSASGKKGRTKQLRQQSQPGLSPGSARASRGVAVGVDVGVSVDSEKRGEKVATGGKSASVLERLCDEFHFGHMKARELLERFSYTEEDLNAWLQFEGGGKGTRLRNHLMKSAKNPKDVEPFENKPRDLGRVSSFNKPGKFDDAKFH